MKLLASKPPQWQHKTWHELLSFAATALEYYGLLTKEERGRVHARLMKKLKQEQGETQ